ncbi:GntR family transcriptional regulator [Arundinibacter roseus]|uniref:GntR family transcriptional regulator n=1 Tax=Arundinibacter roseus TaxID=2070510 RepID=A0A4R4KB76_9BACT|nr:GntR family transcriptional regulator [Arundinibacter roseus]TDB63419.1 GntR family transcriptional regulator [Arundinibacter roseus]
MEPAHYQRLYALLKSQIQVGQFKEGDLLPSENELSTKHKIARMTVRRALTELSNEGYIQKIKGKGSLVSASRKSLGLLSFKGFSEVVGTEFEAKTMMLRAPHAMPWPDRFFYKLSPKEQETGCITFERVRFVDQYPVLLEHSFLPNHGLDTFCSEPLLDGSFFKTLSVRYQIDVISYEQDIRAVVADEVIAFLLKVKPLTPLVQIYRRYHTSVPDYYLYSLLFANTEKYTISNYQ